jgi:hypothetical protein
MYTKMFAKKENIPYCNAGRRGRNQTYREQQRWSEAEGCSARRCAQNVCQENKNLRSCNADLKSGVCAAKPQFLVFLASIL